MTFDKSQDWKLQMVPITIWYLRKASEGDPAFNTSSESAFKAAAKEVDHCVQNSGTRGSPDFTQNEQDEFYMWKDRWENAGGSGLPQIGDKLFALGKFWVVTDVTYTDKDDSGGYQRYKLTCTGSNRSVEA